MTSVLAQYLDKQFTGRFRDPGLQAKVGGAGHVHQHLHDPDPVQVTHRLQGSRKAVECGMAREPSGGLERHLPTDNSLTQQLTVLVRKLARDVDDVAHRPVIYVLGITREVRELQPKGVEPI